MLANTDNPELPQSGDIAAWLHFTPEETIVIAGLILTGGEDGQCGLSISSR